MEDARGQAFYTGDPAVLSNNYLCNAPNFVQKHTHPAIAAISLATESAAREVIQLDVCFKQILSMRFRWD